MAKILLVEDDQVLQKMYHDKLKLEGNDVILAFDGQEGYDRAKTEHPDFILLDLMMPRTDGISCLKLLKEDEETKNIPVAILSVIPEDTYELDSKALLDNTVAYWRKDQTDPSGIVEKINEILNKSPKEGS